MAVFLEGRQTQNSQDNMSWGTGGDTTSVVWYFIGSLFFLEEPGIHISMCKYIYIYLYLFIYIYIHYIYIYTHTHLFHMFFPIKPSFHLPLKIRSRSSQLTQQRLGISGIPLTHGRQAHLVARMVTQKWPFL